MQPITLSITPSSRPVGADATEPSPEAADGFAALLAGLVAPPAIASPRSSGSHLLTLAANSAGNASETVDDTAAPLKDGAVAPDTMTPLGDPLAAGADSPAADAGVATAGPPGAATTGVPHAGVPTKPSAKPGELNASPTGAKDVPRAGAADQSVLAAGIAKPQAPGDATVPPGSVPPAAGRPGGGPPSPHPAAAGQTASRGAAARPGQLAAGHQSPMSPAVAQAEHPAAPAPGVKTRPMLPGFVMAATPGDLGRSELQSSFGELADGSLLRGLATPTAVGGEPSAASLTGAPNSAAAQPVRQLAAVIDRAVAGEIRQLTIQLSPQELGAIDIELSFDEERRLAISILAERPETLELLKGESRQLERLLSRQGIDLANAGLDLGLMSQERGGNGNAHESASQPILVASDEGVGNGDPLSDGTSDTLPNRATGALGADRRLNLSI